MSGSAKSPANEPTGPVADVREDSSPDDEDLVLSDCVEVGAPDKEDFDEDAIEELFPEDLTDRFAGDFDLELNEFAMDVTFETADFKEEGMEAVRADFEFFEPIELPPCWDEALLASDCELLFHEDDNVCDRDAEGRDKDEDFAGLDELLAVEPPPRLEARVSDPFSAVKLPSSRSISRVSTPSSCRRDSAVANHNDDASARYPK